MHPRTPSVWAVVFAAVVLAHVLTGCEAHVLEDEPVALGLEIEGRLGATPIHTANPRAVTQNGVTAHLTNTRVYVSNVVLEREDGTEVPVLAAQPITLPARTPAPESAEVPHTVTEAVVWARLDQRVERVVLGEVPAGRYRAVRYDVGVRGLTNRVDASQAPEEHPLARQRDVGNFWNWNTGYIFIRIDGRLDLNGDGQPDEGPEAALTLHVGFDRNLRTVRHEQPFELRPGQAPHLRLTVDFAELLAGLDLSDPAQRRWHQNPPVEQAVVARVPSAFTFHGVR